MTTAPAGRKRPPKTKGELGTVIVESLAKQLGAKVVISDSSPGTKVTLESVSANAG